ncbi:MAG: ROK family protein [Gammaproteobacteria bacterium]|nr:ROK family protein [Gammaproteobacteria bacterium]
MAVIGIDLGGTKMSGGVVSGDGNVENRVEIPRPRDSAGMVEGPKALVRRLITPEIRGIGLGVAGLVTEHGVMEWGPNVVGEHIPFRRILQEEFSLPVIVDNDANLAALAEATLGAGVGHRSVLMATLGTGMGGGLVIDGEVYRGRGFAGEIGHVVVDVGGPLCTCGQRGCWETFASGRRLDQMARDAVAADPRGRIGELVAGAVPAGRHLTQAAIDGDAEARRLVAEVGGWLGVGLANLIAVLDPDVVVIGGGVSRLGEILLLPARRAVAATLEGYDVRTPTPIVIAAFGEDSALVGAGLAAAKESDV